MSRGSCCWAWEIAVWTSVAAASRLRVRANWSVIWVIPRALAEVSESSPAMVENCRSRGMATDEAIVSGLAPGRLAETCRVGKSTLGRSLMGNERYPMRPKSRMPNMTRVVMTGRRMKSSGMLTGGSPYGRWLLQLLSLPPGHRARAAIGRRSQPFHPV